MNVLKVLLLSQLIIGLAFSTKHVVDRVVARVGKTAILKSEVLAKMSAPGPFEATPKTYEDALSELEETILIKEITAKNNIAVSTEALEHAIDNIAKQNKMTKPQFLNALKAQGLTLEAYKDQLESHLNKMELIRAKISKTVHVSDSEIQAKYAKEYGQKSSLRGSNFGLEVNQISFPKSKKAASKILQIQKLLKSKGANTSLNDLKKINSQLELTELGKIKKGDLVEALDKIIFSTPVGEISVPYESEGNINLFWIKNKHINKPTPLEKVKKDLHNKILEKKLDAAFKRYINEKRRHADIERLDAKKDH